MCLRKASFITFPSYLLEATIYSNATRYYADIYRDINEFSFPFESILQCFEPHLLWHKGLSGIMHYLYSGSIAFLTGQEQDANIRRHGIEKESAHDQTPF